MNATPKPLQHVAYIIRPQHLADGDPVNFDFGFALRQWLAGRNDSLCLTCTQKFDDQEPAAFFIIEFDIHAGAPSTISMSGICEQCAARTTDNELRRAGIRDFFGDELARTAKEFLDPGHGGKPS